MYNANAEEGDKERPICGTENVRVEFHRKNKIDQHSKQKE
jgi:hypothetical protein